MSDQNTGKHSREDTVTRDAQGNVTNMRGTIQENAPIRPYLPGFRKPKHAKD